MTYAQKDYDQIQGNNGVNTIAEVGTLLTAFANLLDRFGEGVDPAILNAAFIEDGVYLYKTDDVRDRLALSSITAYDSTIGISAIGDGRPTTHNAIVRLDYNSALTGGIVSTYALVADNVAGTIIDSFDGVVKPWSVYGEPVAWYGYTQYEAITITPLRAPAPVEELKITLETYTVNHDIKGYASANSDESTIEVKPGTYYIGDTQDHFVYLVPKPGNTFGAWIDINDNQPSVSTVDATVASDTPDNDEVTIPVRVTTSDPLDWQKTYAPSLGVVDYELRDPTMVHDYSDTLADREIGTDVILPIAGYFTIDGVEYARTKKSVDTGHWYGIPKGNLRRVDDTVDDGENIDDNELDGLMNLSDDDLHYELGDDRPSARDKAIKLGATVDGKIGKVTKVLDFRKK